jgi:hypothetical protein
MYYNKQFKQVKQREYIQVKHPHTYHLVYAVTIPSLCNSYEIVTVQTLPLLCFGFGQVTPHQVRGKGAKIHDFHINVYFHVNVIRKYALIPYY